MLPDAGIRVPEESLSGEIVPILGPSEGGAATRFIDEAAVPLLPGGFVQDAVLIVDPRDLPAVEDDVLVGQVAKPVRFR
jgi:hypothetical protein